MIFMKPSSYYLTVKYVGLTRMEEDAQGRGDFNNPVSIFLLLNFFNMMLSFTGS